MNYFCPICLSPLGLVSLVRQGVDPQKPIELSDTDFVYVCDSCNRVFDMATQQELPSGVVPKQESA